MRLILLTRLLGLLLFVSTPLLAQELPSRPGSWPPAGEAPAVIPEFSGHAGSGDVANVARELRSFQHHYPGHPGQRMRAHPRVRRHLSPEERHQLRHDVHQAGRELYHRHHHAPPPPSSWTPRFMAHD